MSRTLSFLMVLVLAVGLLVPATASADFTVTDGPQNTEPRSSHRLIVELASEPLARAERVFAASGSGGKIDFASPEAQAYVQQLQAEQQQFVTDMQRALPQVRVATIRDDRGQVIPATYQVLLNGMAVEAGQDADVDALAKELRRLPGVKRVSRDWAQQPHLYKSIDLINAPALWNHPAIGGMENAGEGIKIASVDGGIHKDAPMFSGAGYTYPPGYPKGDTRNTNGKIIVSRTYFRTWDPPSPGDENPWPGELGTEHGNHTSSIMAGNPVTATFLGAPPVLLRGVAPRAYLMSYRVFYNSITNDGSFYNAEGIRALEDAVRDGADVINNSWGGGPFSLGGEFDALDTALLNASNAGVFVSMSAGNAGPGTATTDHPSEDYITVAATTTGGSYAAGVLEASDPAPVPANLQDLAYQAAAFGGPIPLGQVLGPYPYAAAAVVDPGNEQGCNPFPANAFQGKAALIVRGTCEFGVKALNAQNAGATMFIIYNHETGGDALISMGPGAVGNQVTIPGVFVGNTAGTDLMEWNAANPTTAKLRLSTIAFQVGNTPDVVADFSSRGPAVGGGLNPDIAAPGVNILAQGYAPGVTGEDRHLGFGEASGTSMAAPHVSGAAALMTQVHPNWTPAWIKSALMTTSKYIGIVNEDGTPAQPSDMGAGRLDLTNAADPGVILDPPGVSFGRITMGQTMTETITVTSVATTTQTYTVSTLDTRESYTNTTDLAGVTVSPTTLTLAPGQSAQLSVGWNTAETTGPGDQEGYVVMKSAGYDAHFPVWVRVGYAPDENVGQVLVIDADASVTLELPDYTSYYTETLEAINITYDVWDADAHFNKPMTIPDANYMAQYDAVILQTGEAYQPNGTFTVATPLTQLDMDALTEYANEGGTILAFGQDLTGVVGDDSFFYNATLGAESLQDSINAETVYTETAQLLNGVPESPFSDMSFDISDRGDGAGNQAYIEEVGVYCNDPDTPDLCAGTIPILQYGERGNDVENGYVALAQRDFVTLERPGVAHLGETMYFGFGLEGVNNDTGYNTREDLLLRALQWAWDEVDVTITVDTYEEDRPMPNRVTVFSATVESTFGGEGMTYRWDFGDGTEFTNVFESDTVGHEYARPGFFRVRVEVTNEYGMKVIASKWVLVGYGQWMPMAFR